MGKQRLARTYMTLSSVLSFLRFKCWGFLPVYSWLPYQVVGFRTVRRVLFCVYDDMQQAIIIIEAFVQYYVRAVK